MTPRKSIAALAAVVAVLALPATASAIPTPGAPTITAKPKSIANRSSSAIQWTAGSGATPASYECRQITNGTPVYSTWGSCTSGDTFGGSAGSLITVLIRGVSASGLKGAFSQVTWRIKHLNVTGVDSITSADSTPHAGSVLKAGAINVTDSSGKGAIRYQWYRCSDSMWWSCSTIDSATKSYYQPTIDDAGLRIAVFETYESDSFSEGDVITGSGSMMSPLTDPVEVQLTSQPSLSWSGSLGFGKAISYSIGTFKGGWEPGVETRLEYCSSTTATSCDASYSLTNGSSAYGESVFPYARGTFRLVEGMAVGSHLRLHVQLRYLYNSVVKDYYSPISTETVAGPSTTVEPTITGTAKVGSQMNSTVGTWINSYILSNSELYGFYYARPYVDWYRCTSPTNTGTCVPAHRYETAHWWELQGSWSGWRGYTGYRPTSGDVGYYMRTKATMDLWWPLASVNSGDADSYESGFGPASAKVVS